MVVFCDERHSGCHREQVMTAGSGVDGGESAWGSGYPGLEEARICSRRLKRGLRQGENTKLDYPRPLHASQPSRRCYQLPLVRNASQTDQDEPLGRETR